MKLLTSMGVSTENPANTLPALLAAAEQGYDGIEVDVSATRDDVFVLLRGPLDNQVARNTDGSALSQSLLVGELTYAQLLSYDFGVGFAPKFAGTPVCMLAEALALAGRKGLSVKLRIGQGQTSSAQTEKLFALLADHQDTAMLTFRDPDALIRAGQRLPEMKLHFQGDLTDDTLTRLRQAVPPERLTVWMPPPERLTDETLELARRVKSCACLGIGLVSEYSQLEIAEGLGADMAATGGSVKSVKNSGVFADMHTHSLNSHDPVRVMTDSKRAPSPWSGTGW